MRAKLDFIYKGGKTKRFHTADTLTTQNVAEHSFGVAWFVHLLNPEGRKEVILAALSHDLAEHLVGDVSSPTKRLYPELKNAVDLAENALLNNAQLNFESLLTSEEKRILKLADMFDGMMFCIRERSMGSKVVIPIYENFYNYTVEILKEELTEYKLFSSIRYLWEKTNGR